MPRFHLERRLDSLDKVHLGILGCSEFAMRAMAPAMKETPEIELTGIASRDRDKSQLFAKQFDCQAFDGYAALLGNEKIDAVYIPLPTGLHAEWVLQSLNSGKHVLVEKSFVYDWPTAKRLVDMAREKRLLIMENFLFPHHSQYEWVSDLITKGEIGNLHLFRSNFSIPKLNRDNIRYNAALGGGALLDLGAYVVKATRNFLGNKLDLIGSTLSSQDDYEVDMGGSATFTNKKGQISQVVFKFNSHYQNTWEFFGTKAKIIVDRAYTPPPGFAPVVRIERQNHREEITLSPDNHYINKLRHFAQILSSTEDFSYFWDELEDQSFNLNLIRERAVKV
jgi:NDP-hexose-3-ketoreductase